MKCFKGKLVITKNSFNKSHFFIISLFLSFMLLFFNFLPSVSSDLISINAGGSNEIVITPGANIEGFFLGNFLICGDGVIDTDFGEGCDDGNAVSGDGCSSTCSVETTIPPGGGGGGGGGGVVTQDISVSPDRFEVTLAVNTISPGNILRVTNNGGSQATIALTQSHLNDRVIISGPGLNDTILGSVFLTIPAGSTVNLNLEFRALDETGIFTGIIHVGNRPVLVSISVKTKLLLFDSNIVVLNDDYKVARGDDLLTRVTLVPLGDSERLDVTLDYVIRDYLGNNYLTKKETLLVDRRVQFDRNFDTGSLPVGKYIVGLQLTYPGGVAPSAAYFEVVKRAPITFGTIVLWLIMLISIILIAIIIILLHRRRKKEEERRFQ